MRVTRRQWIRGVFGLGALSLLGVVPRQRSRAAALAAADAVFEPDRRRCLAAAAERVLPGAGEAGVMEYMEYWLSRPPFSRAVDWKPLINVGAMHLDRLAQAEQKSAFADCAPAQQDALLGRFQAGEVQGKGFHSAAFFQRLVTLTLEGFLSDPRYGGNRGGIGFRFIAHQPCWWGPRHTRHLSQSGKAS